MKDKKQILRVDEPKVSQQNSEVELVCDNCGCPKPKKTYDGYWCKMCHNEM